MQNCNGRASFNHNYEHKKLRQPSRMLDREPNNRGGGSFILSVDAPEFVPQKQLPVPHEIIDQPAYQHQQNQNQQQLSQQFQSPHHHVQQLHPAAHINQQQHHQHNKFINHQNQTCGPGRGGGGGSVQDRLNFGGDQQPHQSHHHHQHHQQNLNPQQNHIEQVGESPGPSGPRQQQHHYQQNLNSDRRQAFGGALDTYLTGSQQQQQQQHHQQQYSNLQQNHIGQQAPGPYLGGPESTFGNDATQPLSEAEMTAQNFLIEVLDKLNDDPGMFEKYQKKLISTYIEFAQNEYVISNAIENIFDQSISEQNFRYMGAKICRLLDGIFASPTSVFRHLLCLKINYSLEENIQFTTNEAHKVRGFTLFLAELYIQLQNDGYRIFDIAENIYMTIHLLLKKATPENLKCVCQTLKLCGYELKLDFPTETAKIIMQLKTVKDIDVSTERLLKSVLDLSQNRWGRIETVVIPTPDIENTMREFTCEPVCYGPDGKIITEEESSFLSDITAYPSENFDDDDYNDDVDDSDPEMDLEMRIAFKDFVKGYTK